mgnify:FL=1
MHIVAYDNIYKRQEEMQTVVGFSVFVREFHGMSEGGINTL